MLELPNGVLLELTEANHTNGLGPRRTCAWVVPDRPKPAKDTNRMHVHFFSPPRCFEPSPEKTIAQCWTGVGGNTGNQLFINALAKQVKYDTCSFGYSIDVERVNSSVDLIVIPAANWLKTGGDLTSWWRALRDTTPPIFIAGVGAHTVGFDNLPKLSEGTIQFMRMVSSRTKVIATRGEFTTQVLNHYGIKNVRTTGCPSLYSSCTPEFSQVRPVSDLHMSQVALQATRHEIGDNRSNYSTGRQRIERLLFLAARFSSAHYIVQSEREELSLLLRRPETLTPAEVNNILHYYGLDSLEDINGFIDRARVFFDLADWLEFLRSLKFCIGSRLHGCIASLTAGTKACLLTHDARTRELAVFAQLPSMEAADFAADVQRMGLSEAVALAEENCQIEPFLERYPENYSTYRETIEENGVAHNMA